MQRLKRGPTPKLAQQEPILSEDNARTGSGPFKPAGHHNLSNQNNFEKDCNLDPKVSLYKLAKSNIRERLSA